MPTAVLAPNVRQRFFDENGAPLAGGKLYTYVGGSAGATPKATYKDANEIATNTNPIVLDADGYADIWLQDDGTYYFVLKDALGNTIWTVDFVPGGPHTVLDAVFEALEAEIAVINTTLNNAFFFKQNATYTPYTLNSKLQQTIAVTDDPYKAKGDGTTDDYAAFNSANTDGRQVVIPKGTYLIGSNINLASVILLKGAVLKPASGVTITISGSFDAPLAKVFDTSLGGTITFDPATDIWARPEWWGAVVNGPDCYAAITAALAASIRVKLSSGDYFTSATIKIIRGHQQLRGAGSEWASGTYNVTRLLVNDGSSVCLQVGPDTAPSDINHFQLQNDIRDLYVARAVVPVKSSGCSAIKFQYTLSLYGENLKTNESMNGFEFYANVYLQLYRCAAVRESLGSGGSTDGWNGFYLNGNALFGAAGGNASVYLNYCRAACNNPTLSNGNSNGFYCDANYTDIFLESFETVSCAVGINVQGNTSGTIATNVDLQIKHPSNDACTKYCIFINNVNPEGCVEIIGGYYGPAASATHALLIQNSYGVSVKGGQFVMLAAAASTAIGCLNSKGISIQKTIILEAIAGAVVMSGCSNFDVQPMVKNYINALTAPAVLITGNSTRSYSRPLALGGAGKIAQGVRVDTAGDTFHEVNCSGIDANCIAGGSANKLHFGATQITATGTFNTNCLASGIMG